MPIKSSTQPDMKPKQKKDLNFYKKFVAELNPNLILLDKSKTSFDS